MLNVGIIGMGYWGKNYLRVFNEIQHSRVVWCADINKETLRFVNENYPSIKTSINYFDILNDDSVDCVCVATNASQHYKISRDALLANKHLLIEKPLTLDSKKGEELVKLAKGKNRVLMVGHTYI